MNTQKKKLLTNLTISFLILFSVCLCVALIINLKFSQDCATVITAMLGVCATLYAPIAAFFLYDSWKEQKQYDIEKQYAEEAFKLVAHINNAISREYYSFKSIKSDLFVHLVALNVLYDKISDVNYSEKLYDLEAIFELINDISYRKIDITFFREFEYIFILLRQKLKDTRGVYDEYYKELPENLKTTTNNQKLNKNTYTYKMLKNDQLNNHEKSLMKHLNNKFQFQIDLYHEGNYIYYEYTLQELYENFELRYKELKNKKKKKIKVNKELT